VSAPFWIRAVGVPPELAAQLEAVLLACPGVPSFDEIRSRVRGIDPDVDRLLVTLRQAAVTHRASVDGSIPRKSTEVAVDSNQTFTPDQAAAQLHVTAHAVRLAIRQHRLEAEQDENRRWRITRSALELFRKRRP
jgi:excisionase family DNA binding protein